MKQYREFDDILNECLERLLSGETLEQCLQSFPEYAPQLKPLLETTLEVKKVSALQPSVEFKEKARRELCSALREVKPRRRLFFDLQPRWVTAVVTIIMLLLVGGGTVVAASNSMPDELLYSVKLATEGVRLSLTPSALGKAEYYVKLADARVLEIERMADENKPEQIVETAQRLDNVLANLATTQEEKRAIMMAPQLDTTAEAPPPPTVEEAPPLPTTLKGVEAPPPQSPPVDRQAILRETLREQAAANTERLRTLLETVPEPAKPALLQAITISEAAYAKALKSLE